MFHIVMLNKRPTIFHGVLFNISMADSIEARWIMNIFNSLSLIIFLDSSCQLYISCPEPQFCWKSLTFISFLQLSFQLYFHYCRFLTQWTPHFQNYNPNNPLDLHSRNHLPYCWIWTPMKHTPCGWRGGRKMFEKSNIQSFQIFKLR